MTIDRKRAENAFAAYVRPYSDANPGDAKVRLKIEHTYRVAALCEQIARSLTPCEGGPLPEEEIALAWLCGLLHDVGRFEQLRRYGTFNDALSIDHAACSAEVLFAQGQIRAYVADTAEDALLRTAVATHSSYRLPAGLDSRTARFCNLLRDADKIDILKVNVEVPMEDIYNVSTAALRSCPVSEAVLENFYENHAIPRALKQTPVDNAVGHISLVYELVYPESLRIALAQGYLNTLLHFESDNPATRHAFAAMRAHMQGWLDARLGTAPAPRLDT
ncbi:MAG: HD domain-containing protein [Gemmiger sp.]|nr:HD domain-containing protein [Gemmiger sp.]